MQKLSIGKTMHILQMMVNDFITDLIMEFNMKEIIFSDQSKGYAIEVTYKDGNVHTKYFTAKEFNKLF